MVLGGGLDMGLVCLLFMFGVGVVCVVFVG